MPIQEIPESSKMHAVPQNFMDVEFKLIGDLTMRQFTYLLVNGVIAYLVYSLVHGIFKWPLVLFFVLLGLGLAFVPVQERGLDVWIVNLVRAIYTPTQRIWKKQPSIPSAFAYENINVVKQEMITLAPTSSRRKLEEFLKYKGDNEEKDPLDIPEKDYIMKVKEAFVGSTPSAGQTPIIYGKGMKTPVIDRTVDEKLHQSKIAMPPPGRYSQDFQSPAPASEGGQVSGETPEIPGVSTGNVADLVDDATVTREAQEIIDKMQGKKVPQIKFEQPKSPDYFAPQPTVTPPAVSTPEPVKVQKPEIPIDKASKKKGLLSGLFSKQETFEKPVVPEQKKESATPVVQGGVPAPGTGEPLNAVASSSKPSLDDIWEGNM